MKKIFLIAVLSLVACHFTLLHAQKSNLSCTCRGLEKSVRIVVNEPQGGRLSPADTLTPDKNGRITLSRYSYTPQFIALSLLPSSNGPFLHVILLPQEEVTLEVDYMPAINHFNITSAKGSDNMTLYKGYTNMLTELVQNQQTALLDSRMEALLDAHPGVLMSAFLVTYFEQSFEQHVALYKKIRDALIGQWPNEDFVKHLDSRVRSTMIGIEAPDIELADPEGKMRKLSDLRGKVVLIDFWASWCRPCRAENPNVVRLYQKYHDKGFEIFSVSLDNNREAWIKAIADDHLVWPNHVSDLRGWSSAGGRLYGVQSIPSTVLVGPDGMVLARNLRGQQLENKLNEIFNK